ncbi:MAG: hypothetical protein AB1689_20720, partial [Thermodesulfobacteriota bacterium]
SRATSPGERARRIAEHLALAVRALERRAVRIERPRGRVELALGDPAQTGRAYGLACAVAALADPAGAVRIAPLWTVEDWLAADLTLGARVHPLRLALVAAGRWLRRRPSTARSGVAGASAHAA